MTATEQRKTDERAIAAYMAGMAGWDGPFTADALMARAESLVGLSDWGGARWEEDQFRHDLAILCDAIEETGDVSAIGRQRSFTRLLTMLLSRLRYLDMRKKTPSIDKQRILAPIVGTGMPRAGTTFLHGVLAQDPDLRVARAFEAAIPVPLPDRTGDRRLDIYDQLIAFQGMTDARMRAIHPFGADLPEECLFMQEGACTAIFGGLWNVPTFMAAMADKNTRTYRWQAGIMQYLQAGHVGKRWALKTGGHIMAWDEMRLAFPDALIYVNHRDPGKVIPSMASLMVALRGLYSDQPMDLAAAGREQLELWTQVMNDYAGWRRGPGQQAQVFDVTFSDLVADPLTVVASLYDSFGINLSAAAREAMERHLAVDQHGKGPQRNYSLEEFGMDDADIETAFGAYIEQFGIKRERTPRV